MPIHKKKRAFEKARPVSNTKLHLSTGKQEIKKLRKQDEKIRVRRIRTRGGNF